MLKKEEKHKANINMKWGVGENFVAISQNEILFVMGAEHMCLAKITLLPIISVPVCVQAVFI